MIDTKETREKIRNSYLESYLAALIYDLCDEIDRLQEKEDDRSAWGTGPVRLKEAEEEIKQFQDEIVHLNGINKKNSDYNFNVRKAQKEEIIDLKQEISELMFLELPLGQEKKLQNEISDLKSDLATARNINVHHQTQNIDLHKEVTELKAELNRQLSGCDYEARVKLTKVIRVVLNQLFDGVAFTVVRELNDAINEWGVKE